MGSGQGSPSSDAQSTEGEPSQRPCFPIKAGVLIADEDALCLATGVRLLLAGRKAGENVCEGAGDKGVIW